jgi:hypothetical protein
MAMPGLGFTTGLDDGFEALLRVGFTHRVLANLAPQKIEPYQALVRH